MEIKSCLMDEIAFKLLLAAHIKNLLHFERYLLTFTSYVKPFWTFWNNLFVKCSGFYHRQLPGRKKEWGVI